MQTLSSQFDPRHNALGDLRLGLAATVVLVHAMAIGLGHQPYLGHTAVGSLAVDAFFVLSGFLIARSYLSLNSLARFAWHRGLRIMPAFWVCLLATALLISPAIALLNGGEASSVLGGNSDATSYLSNNLFLHIGQYDINGYPLTSHTPGVFNGALWTLFYEALCYLGVAVLGLLGALRRRPALVWAATAGALALIVASQVGLLPAEPSSMFYVAPRFALLFLFGVLGHQYADVLPIRDDLAALSGAALIITCLALDDYRVIGGAALAYLCLWAAVRLPARAPRADLSYGLYIWHWPLIQVMVAMGAVELGTAPYLAAVFLGTAAVAWASWRLIEAPALSLKDLGRRSIRHRVA